MGDKGAVRVGRVATGIPGFEQLSLGGLPGGRVTLVAGPAGSGKTVMALQYLVEGVRQFDEPGVFVTLAEGPDKLREAVVEFGWEVPAWEAAGRWEFVDATLGLADARVLVGEHVDLTVLLNRITAAVARTGARRVAVDSLQVLFGRFGDSDEVRDVLLRLSGALDQLGVTTVMTIGKGQDDGQLAGSGVEEYVADNVVLLRNTLAEEARRRTIEVLKLRGTGHRQGEFPFAITSAHGLVVIPLTVRLDQPSDTARITTGNTVLDEMTGGGLYQCSVTLLSGPTGTGKTALSLAFALAGAARGEPTVVVHFEESRAQILRGIAAWGYDVPALEQQGLLRFVVDYPEVRTFEQHLVLIQSAVEEIGATRLVVDSLSSVRRSGSERSFREFAIGLTAYAKNRGVATLLTTAQASIVGPEVGATQEHVSALADAILLLRYVEVYGEVKRGLLVLKLRGSGHMKTIREYVVDEGGIHIGAPLRTTTGILSGRTTQLDTVESARVDEEFGTQR